MYVYMRCIYYWFSTPNKCSLPACYTWSAGRSVSQLVSIHLRCAKDGVEKRDYVSGCHDNCLLSEQRAKIPEASARDYYRRAREA